MTPRPASSATLVFPAVDRSAIDYVAAARQRGEATVLAASVASPEVAAECGEVHRLPSIYDADFAERLLALVETHDVARVFCPVAGVHAFVRRFIATHGLALTVLGASPITQQVEAHRRLMARAQRLLPLAETCADGAATLSLVELAGVLRQAGLIYGESNDDKLAAMIGVAADAPAGDVVEIGSLMGRSASVLLYLAWRHQLGPLLTIDPWTAGNALQRQSPQSFQELVDEWDFEVLREGFLVNMVPLRAERHAHLRLPSAAAFEVYAQGQPIAASPESAPPVAFDGRIGLIHIDGNHDYDCVANDCRQWLPRLLPQAWLILDDYLWAHGDGPYRVGNALLHEQGERVSRAFTCGKALFVKFK
ncbi:class I SAM-dependent methyltransferase [Accumulibacter sp.]|uniref:class I SAM-dependent methyltransferase n=1 Tax=Accumulibacter sp. TaxID=2053492 RepID=UPI002B77DE30|nr:class I SAM-dependent methyltransferase [Accumulibacter sp.]HMW65078.1 class I SAM-dependent methyltransferase [Accumulibacter sp.]HNB68230.1 class I SAM-dependent methyltransferase [Accumulibacter sp.]HNE41488.1 class I SAM-dependent methyltransferase [Accumulibacter sp.]HNI51331.1 class I SAM-dependent methyltransferase [Accumulibacter sp.]HNJ50900.1 class I SAM-dependent methyltransferase [Accumulibacter sp.]